MAIFTELLGNTYMVEVGVEALKLAHKSQTYNAEIWCAFFEQIEHSMTCERREACDYHATPEFLHAARSSLERVAQPTMIALFPQNGVRSGSKMKYLLLWKGLVSLLGITEETIRERYRADRKCCNLSCPTRNSGAQIVKKSTCVQCKAVFYCDRECQRR